MTGRCTKIHGKIPSHVGPVDEGDPDALPGADADGGGHPDGELGATLSWLAPKIVLHWSPLNTALGSMAIWLEWHSSVGQICHCTLLPLSVAICLLQVILSGPLGAVLSGPHCTVQFWALHVN